MRKNLVNQYSSELYDLIIGTQTHSLSEEDLKKDFMGFARKKWFLNAIQTFSQITAEGAEHRMSPTGKANTVLIDIPENTPSGVPQQLEIKVSIKIKD